MKKILPPKNSRVRMESDLMASLRRRTGSQPSPPGNCTMGTPTLRTLTDQTWMLSL